MISRQSIHRLALAGLAAASLAACGKETSEPAAPAASRPAPSGNASAEQVAAEGRKGLDCPADLDTPPRAARAPVDDVVGVRPGLSYEEARNLVLCTDELLVISDGARGFNIKTYGATIRQGFGARFAEPRVHKTSREIMNEMQDDFMARSGNSVRQDMKPGQAKWHVTTMGTPGHERVIAAAREEWFAEGRNPTMEGVSQALIEKYGTPTRRQIQPHMIQLTWIHDPAGRFVAETGPLANACTPMSDPDGGASFSPDCGIVVSARVNPSKDNPQLAQSLQVGVADQAGGYQLLVETEQALEAQEMRRRQQQVVEAGKNADAPRL